MLKYIKANAHMKREVEILTFCDMEQKRKRIIMESPPTMWG